ncbi:MAG TPA: hypothetical protein VM165_04150 [Planctomycetaceae bacterium]|nr:hypothetical protein [Planctomycetaceae bacterium]
MSEHTDDDLERSILAEMPQLLERDRRRQIAMSDNSISGQLRRAISQSRLRYEPLALEAGVSFEELADFMAGDAPLPSTAIDRLAAVLHQTLVPAG